MAGSGPLTLVTTGEENDRSRPGPSRVSSQRRKNGPNWQAVKKNAQRTFVSAVERIMSIAKSNKEISDLMHDPTDLPRVMVGPVIGKVTETSARVLLELDNSGKVTMVVVEMEEPKPTLETTSSTTATAATNGEANSRDSRKLSAASLTDSRRYSPGHNQVCERTLRKGIPGVFTFQNLSPGTLYKIKMKGCDMRQSSSFRTFSEDQDHHPLSRSLNFAVISCNKIFITQKEIPAHSDLWAHLAKAVELGKIDMCLHVGDQIYGDGDKGMDAEVREEPDDWSDCFRRSKALLNDIPKEKWVDKYETVCDWYRDVYRKTWSHQYTATCLANCPNLMIYDDHEVRDNWADLEVDWDSSTMDFFIARCAWKVSLEYQRQLHEDVNFDKIEDIDKDYHFHSVSGVGVMFLDVRGSRTFHRVADDQYKYLGLKQWQDIEAGLEKGGIFDDVHVLLVCTPAPLVFLQNNVTDAFAKRVSKLEDFKGHWSAALHFKEQKKMIDRLCQWKNASQNRDVLVLGGDVHCGGHSEILKDRRVMFRQMTTSAIANHPLPKSAYYFLRVAETLSGVGPQSVSFRHHGWTRSRNYGLVYIRNHGPKASMKPEITSQLIKGKFMTGISEGEKVTNIQTSSTGFSKCFGLR